MLIYGSSWTKDEIGVRTKPPTHNLGGVGTGGRKALKKASVTWEQLGYGHRSFRWSLSLSMRFIQVIIRHPWFRIQSALYKCLTLKFSSLLLQLAKIGSLFSPIQYCIIFNSRQGYMTASSTIAFSSHCGNPRRAAE